MLLRSRILRLVRGRAVMFIGIAVASVACGAEISAPPADAEASTEEGGTSEAGSDAQTDGSSHEAGDAAFPTCVVVQASGGCSTGPAQTEAEVPSAPNMSDGPCMPRCVPRCGADELVSLNGYQEYTFEALPSGACRNDGETCQMDAARSTSQCAGQPKHACDVSDYVCHCESGTWRCYLIAAGAGVCPLCVDDAGAGDQ